MLTTISSALETTQPLVVHSTATLREVLEQWNRNQSPYLVVSNEEGYLSGIADMRYVHQLLNATNAVERVRWEDVCVGAIAENMFVGRQNENSCSSMAIQEDGTIRGMPLCDPLGCAAIVANGETFVNWSRISTAMQQHHFDPVTHLPLRKSFNRRLREELDRAARSGQAISLLLIDLDHFKQINDQFGHPAGDLALRSVAGSLLEGVRSYDFVARYGGDEFAVICYDCGPDQIRLPITRLQSSVSSLAVSKAATHGRISLSIGAAVLTNVCESCTPEAILEQADICLYRAKHAGRSTSFAVELNQQGEPISSVFKVDRVE